MAYVKSIISVWIHSFRQGKTQTQIFSAQFLTESIWQQMAARPLHRWDIHLSLDCYCHSQWLHFLYTSLQLLYSFCISRSSYTLSLHWFVFSWGRRLFLLLPYINHFRFFFLLLTVQTLPVRFLLIQTFINNTVCERECLLFVPVWQHHSCYLYSDE